MTNAQSAELANSRVAARHVARPVGLRSNFELLPTRTVLCPGSPRSLGGITFISLFVMYSLRKNEEH